jgi:hypothetical protein
MKSGTLIFTSPLLVGLGRELRRTLMFSSASAAPQGSYFGGLIWRNVGLRNLLESRLRGASKHRNSPAGCKRRTRTKENRYGQSKRHH